MIWYRPKRSRPRASAYAAADQLTECRRPFKWLSSLENRQKPGVACSRSVLIPSVAVSCDSKGILAIITILAASCVAYFLSSGVAFVVMYRVGTRFPSKLAGLIYTPLEALARRSRLFSDYYNGFLWWMYRRFVNDSPSAPPPRLAALMKEHEGD